MMEESTFADLKRSLVDALVQSGLAGSAGDMTECQAHEVAEVAARIAWPLSREVAHLQKDNAGWRQRVEGLEATLETARNSAVEDIRLLDQLRRDRATAESSRRAWAAEAMRLEMAFDEATRLIGEEIAWQKAAYPEIKDTTDRLAIARTIGMEDALRTLRDTFCRPVGAVHPGADWKSDADAFLNAWDPDWHAEKDCADTKNCDLHGAAVEGGA